MLAYHERFEDLKYKIWIHRDMIIQLDSWFEFNQRLCHFGSINYNETKYQRLRDYKINSDKNK